MANLGTLTLDLIAKVGGFTGPLDQASRHAKKRADDISRSVSGLKGMFSSIFPQAAAVASIAGLVHYAKSTIDMAAEIGKASQKFGIAAEELSKLKHSAALANLDFEDLGMGLKFMAKAMLDSSMGASHGADAFHLLGIHVKDAEGRLRPTEEVLYDIADAFGAMEDGAAKTALSMQIFGKKHGDHMIPLLNRGAEAFREEAEEARRLGIVISTETAKAANEFNDNLTRLTANIKGMTLPAINALTRGINGIFDVFKMDNWEKLAAAEKELERLKKNAESRSPFSRFSPQVRQELQAKIKEKEDEIVRLREQLTHKGEPKQKDKGPQIPDDDAKRQKEAIEKQVAALKELNETYGKTEVEAGLYKLTLAGATKAQLAEASAALTALEAKKKSAKEFEDSHAAVNKQVAEGLQLYEALRTPMEVYKERLEELAALYGNGAISLETYKRAADQAFGKLTEGGKRVFDATRTPMEALNAELKELAELYEQGAISADTFGRAVEQAEDGLGEKIKKVKEEGKDQFADLKQAIEGWGQSSADVFAEFAISGKASFSDLANSIIKDLIKMAAYKAVFEPMFRAISSISSALFPTAPAKTTASAHGNVFDTGKVIPFAKGGVINRPMTFPLGLAGEAGPEAILPLRRIGGDLGVKADLGGMRGGGAWTIEIINKGEPAQITDAKFDFQRSVVTIWMDAHQRDVGGLRRYMGG